jgi:AraC-like DNA-binding protein
MSDQTKNRPPLLHALDSLAASLLEEAGLSIAEGTVDQEAFIRLYRSATELLTARAAARDGKAALTAKEVAFMCRCMLCCATLQEAIESLIDFAAMVGPGAGTMSVTVEDERATFIIDTGRKQPTRASCLVDVTGMLGFLQLFGWLIGESLRVRSVVLGYPNREDAAPFLRLFGAPVYVGHATYRLEFDAAQMAKPVLRRPEELRDFLRTIPYNVVGTECNSRPLRFQVRACMDAALAQGQRMPGPAVLAGLVGASSTTLRRRLHGEGTSYTALRDLSLREAAERYLVSTDREIDQIADQLGFSDAITFRRAFRRWTGLAPSEYRRRIITKSASS